MKKIFAIVLAIVMVFSMSAIAFAADEAPAEEAVAAEDAGALGGIQDVINSIIGTLSLEGVLDGVKSIIDKIISLIESVAAKSAVLGAVADLEAKVGDLGLLGDILEHIENLINTLKQKIKNFYAGLKATIEPTQAESSANTGSSSAAGLVALAAISVSAAAAFVCTKKKED